MLFRSVEGCYKFLCRVYRLFSKYQDIVTLDYKIPENLDSKADKLLREVHISIKKITNDIENEFQFNTVVSRYRELTNAIYDYIKDENAIEPNVLSFALLSLLKLISPVAVYMSEEIYAELAAKANIKGSIHELPWPKYDENLAKLNDLTLIVQINGKIRDKIETTNNQTNEVLTKLAMESEKVQAALEGKTIVKTIVVPNKLVNIVVK